MVAVLAYLFCGFLCLNFLFMTYVFVRYVSGDVYKVTAISYIPENPICGKYVTRWCNCLTKFLAMRVAKQYIREIKGLESLEITFHDKLIWKWQKEETT